MPRDIPVGNGALLVNFDERYQMRDLYWPHVGQENHTVGHPSRFGVWVDGRFSWVSDDEWQRTLDYDHDTLITRVLLHHPGLGVRLTCEDAVDIDIDLYLRSVVVANEAPREREVRLFFHHDLSIGGYAVGDTAYYDPQTRAIFHYKGKRWFMVHAAHDHGPLDQIGIDQWATGVKRVAGQEGTWRDAEDGELSGNSVTQGSVDSCVALHLTVPAGGEATAWHWIAVGETHGAVLRIDQMMREQGPAFFLERTRSYWTLWANKDDPLRELPDPVAHLFRRSLLVLRTQIDRGGAIIAANDSDIIQFSQDTYSYMWPRDGALVAAGLVAAGYSEVPRRFFQFCHRVISDEGYLLHKYNPDGSLASTWHGWYYDGEEQLPVQEDETALVIWALWQHYQRFRDVEFVKTLYRDLICRAADWMVAYRDPADGLPRPSWDLWEERRGVLAWTVGATWGGLRAAANFAEAFGERDRAERYRQAAQEVRDGVATHLWSDDLGRYLRMVNRRDDGRWERDPTLDASLCGLWQFGILPPDDPRIAATMVAVRDRLWVKTEVGGVARYEDDYYHQVSRDIARVPGNPWFICTLWLAQWHIATATSVEDLAVARDLLRWAGERSLPSGVMAEQVHPYTHAPLSVSPLTWSHSTLVMTVADFERKLAELGGDAAEALAWGPDAHRM